jgi:hypothetical protein
MKFLVSVSFLLLSFHFLQAQWPAGSAGAIYYNGGNVGIGTGSPNALLELKNPVAGGLGPVLRLTGGGSAGAQCAIDLATYDPGTAMPAGRILATDDAYWGCNIDFQSKQSGALVNSMVTRLRIDNNGNVGIGTTTPQARLAVNGDIFAKKVKVTLTGWSDYVFHANYRLRPLSEVEQYIHQHHHLPEVVSADEVEKNGLDVGDNQAVLLKKIEELTLYLIEQNKNQQTQQQQLQELSRQVKGLQKENEALKKQLLKK